MSASCPTCGRTLPAPRKAKADNVLHVSDGVVTANLSDRELYAYYKRIAHVEDVRFMLAHATMSPTLRAAVSNLLDRAPTMTRANCLREHVRNLTTWRLERNAAEQLRWARHHETDMEASA